MADRLMWTSAIPDHDHLRRDIHGRGLALGESLRAVSEETIATRRIPARQIDELRRSGIAQILQPARYGGLEAPLASMADALIPLAAGCGSSAWAIAQYIMHNYMIGRWSEAAQDRIWQEMPDALVSGILIPRMGKARIVPGGYELTGRWPLVSGVDMSDWCILSAFTHPEGDALPVETYFLLPIGQVQIIDTWRSSGLRGSASNDVCVEALFVADEMTVTVDQLKGGVFPGRAANAAAIYRAPVYMTFGALLTSAVIGMAEAMLATYLTERPVRVSGSGGAEPSMSQQLKIAEAASAIRAAEALLADNFERMTRYAQRDLVPDDTARTAFRSDATFAGALATRAATLVWDVVGGRAAYEENYYGRIQRDLTVASRHLTQNWDANLAEHGRVLLGLGMTNTSL